MGFDHQRIRDRRDRRHSLALLEALLDPYTDEAWDELAKSLAQLADPRVVAPLEAALHDRARLDEQRRSIAAALREMGNRPMLDDGALGALWVSDDAIVQEYALLQMTWQQRDLVEAVLDQPAHPLLVAAVLSLAFDFDDRWASARLIAALGHERADVREAAADTLVWSEPLAASEALLRATTDHEPSVAAAALDTLCYYPMRAVLEHAHALLEHDDRLVRKAARNCVDWLREDFKHSLADAERDGRLWRWVRPIATLLELDEPAIEGIDAPEPSKPGVPFAQRFERFEWLASLESFRARFESLDCPWQERCGELRRADWAAVALADRSTWAATLLSWPDVLVRQQAPRALARWHDAANLVALLDNRDADIRKSAMYHLRELPPDPALAELAFARIPNLHCTAAYEALETAIALGDPPWWIPRARVLVLDPAADEGVRFHAIHALINADAREVLRECIPLLEQPPVLTWAIHLALLDAARKLALPLPSLAHLEDVDNLYVQQAFDRLERARP